MCKLKKTILHSEIYRLALLDSDNAIVHLQWTTTSTLKQKSAYIAAVESLPLTKRKSDIFFFVSLARQTNVYFNKFMLHHTTIGLSRLTTCQPANKIEEGYWLRLPALCQ